MLQYKTKPIQELSWNNLKYFNISGQLGRFYTVSSTEKKVCSNQFNVIGDYFFGTSSIRATFMCNSCGQQTVSSFYYFIISFTQNITLKYKLSACLIRFFKVSLATNVGWCIVCFCYNNKFYQKQLHDD